MALKPKNKKEFCFRDQACRGTGLTHQQIADIYGISQQAVQGIIQVALKKIRRHIAKNGTEAELRDHLID